MAVTDARFRQHVRRGGEMALLCCIDHPDGETYLWSRVGTLNWDGQEWRGIGALGRVSGISKTTTLEVKQITFELAGVPMDSVNLVSDDVRNRSIKLWLAAIERQKVVGQPYLIVDDLMDYQTLSISDDGKTATLKITVAVGFWSIERANNSVWSHESQIAEYAGDSGLSLLTSLANKQTNWRLS